MKCTHVWLHILNIWILIKHLWHPRVAKSAGSTKYWAPKMVQIAIFTINMSHFWGVSTISNRPTFSVTKFVMNDKTAKNWHKMMIRKSNETMNIAGKNYFHFEILAAPLISWVWFFTVFKFKWSTFRNDNMEMQELHSRSKKWLRKSYFFLFGDNEIMLVLGKFWFIWNFIFFTSSYHTKHQKNEIWKNLTTFTFRICLNLTENVS